MCTHSFEIFCVLCGWDLPDYTKNICTVAWKNGRIWFIYDLDKCLAPVFAINIHGMGALPTQLSFHQVYFWAQFVFLFCSSLHHTTNMANIPSILGIFWSYVSMECTWVFKPWSNDNFWCFYGTFLRAAFLHKLNFTLWEIHVV